MKPLSTPAALISTVLAVLCVVPRSDAWPHKFPAHHHGGANRRVLSSSPARSGSSLVLAINGSLVSNSSSFPSHTDSFPNPSAIANDLTCNDTIETPQPRAAPLLKVQFAVDAVQDYLLYDTPHTTGQSGVSPALSESSKVSETFRIPTIATTFSTNQQPQANLTPSPALKAVSDHTIQTSAPGIVPTQVLKRAATSSASASGNFVGDGSYQSFQLGGFLSATSSSSAISPNPSSTASTVCPVGNGTTYTSSAGKKYRIVCDVDIVEHDYPFHLVNSFDACVAQCDTYNVEAGRNVCLASLYVPSRAADLDDCYIKTSTNDQIPASSYTIEGAFLVEDTQSSLSASAASKSSTVSSLESSMTSSSVQISATASSLSVAASSYPDTTTTSAQAPYSSAQVSQGGVVYASGTTVVVPTVSSSALHGPSQNKPTTQYLKYKPPTDLTLLSNLLTVGVNGALSTAYAIAEGTGVLEVNATTQSLIADLQNTPHISRDGGKGGYLNGQHLFIFCDTGIYTTTTSSSNGKFLGFMSSSVAVDTGMNGLHGNSLYLQDGIGQWSDDQGRMRGFSPMTQGEQSYNLAMQGKGQRYAIWPESSIIPLDSSTGLIYAPIVYDNVDMATKAAVFTYTGATVLTITAGGKGGPIANRVNERIFNQDEVEWGCVGGIRSWGTSGIGGTDGYVYLFGNTQGGILLARTTHDGVADRNSYQYWAKDHWDSEMQPPSSSAWFVSGAIMDIDLFYSPRHLTFIMVYMTVWADNIFYYRYLNADSAILPPYAGGNASTDYVENILKYPWSVEEILYKASPGKSGKYIYSGGIHQGYFGTNDITNGGSKALLSWTAPTGDDPASLDSEYQIITAEVSFA